MMKYLDCFYDIHKRWATKREVMKLCCCSHDEALKILEELECKAQNIGFETLRSSNDIYVPMCVFLDYLGVNRVNRINNYHNSLIEFGF